jgi:hypothetical protein
MKENALIVQTLNYSVYQEILQLNDIFNYITEKNLTVSYKFDHSDEGDGENGAFFNFSTLEKCRCLYDCQDFLLFQASQYPKSYADFFRSILIERKLNLQTFTGFGVNSVFSFLQQQFPKSKKKQKRKKGEDYSFDYLSIQEGGGGGLGFQLYCDDIVVLSAGGRHFL